MTQSVGEIAPVVEGLFESTDSGVYLIGTRCRSCGALYFPVTLSCRNPDCKEKVVETMRLPRTGVIYSYTLQHYRPPPLFRMEPWAPYALASIEFEGGLRVMGMVTGAPPDALVIGMPVEVVLEQRL